jgi:hypothetical protein
MLVISTNRYRVIAGEAVEERWAVISEWWASAYADLSSVVVVPSW